MEKRILEILLIARTNSMTKEQIYKKLGYTNLSFEEFEETLEDMKKKHLIYQTGKNSYIKNPFKEGIVTITKKGEILVKTNEETIKIAENIFNCVTGDKVRIRITDPSENKGTITEVIERKGIIAEVITINKKRYALAKNTKYKIDLPPNIVDGMIIGIKISKEAKTKEPVAILNRVIGHKNKPRIDEEIILYENNFNYEWNEKIINEVKNIPNTVKEEDLKNRKDLRNKIIFTIDGDDTKDIDDAISLEKTKENNYLLGVHIADVSNYVKENSELDIEARQRATSVYMNTVVNPMYPVELSNGICSLNPEEDRLAMTCEMEINPEGKVIKFDIFESVIHSRKQMTYKNVNKILEENNTPEDYKEYEQTIKEMCNLSEILKKNRIKRGYQDFDLPEIKIITDEKGNPTEITQRTQNKGEKLIESFMLQANETVATYIFLMGIPSIYRNHDKPDEERLKRVINVIKTYGDEITTKGKINSKYIQSLLKEVAKTERKEVYSNLILRCLAKATYEAYNIGHFSVGIDSERKQAYTHFTSPIRRYPDTTVHRILKKILHGQVKELYQEEYKNKIIEIAKHSSTQEQNADKCERESNKMKMAEYMQNHINEEYEATITGFTNSGMFASLKNLIEGRIGYDTMDDYYNYNQDLEMAIGEKTNKTYKLGDKIKIKVVKASKELREIDFEIVKGENKQNGNNKQKSKA